MWATKVGGEFVAAPAVTSDAVYAAVGTMLYKPVEGGGHSWPGEPEPRFGKTFGPGTTEINATDLMFRMFFGPH